MYKSSLIPLNSSVFQKHLYNTLTTHTYSSGDSNTMDTQFKENVIKSFGIVKGDVTAIQATLADISLAIADANSRHEKLVGEMHKIKIANVKFNETIKALRVQLKAKIKAKKSITTIRHVSAKATTKKKQ